MPSIPLSAPNVHSSSVLSDLVFSSHVSAVYGHVDHTVHRVAETVEHRRMRSKHLKKSDAVVSNSQSSNVSKQGWYELIK